MNEEQMRKGFEEWMGDGGASPRAIERNSKGDYILMQAASAWEVWKAAHTHYAKPAAPVVLPEPVVALYTVASRFIDWVPCTVGFARKVDGGIFEVEYAYTEQQVRELLATATQVPAQDITEKAAKYDHLLPYLCKTCGGYGLLDRRSNDDPLGSEPCPDCNAAPQPLEQSPPTHTPSEVAGGSDLYCTGCGRIGQIDRVVGAPPADVAPVVSPEPKAPQQQADALDSARYRFLRSRDLETVNNGGVFAGVTPDNIVLNGTDLDAEIDAAIAAAKGSNP